MLLRVCRAGSIERLIDGDKRIIATKHLLPENNINVVVRYLARFALISVWYLKWLWIIMTTSILILLRIRPLSNKEIKSGDEMAVQFPGDGQIYVSARELY